jgi:hypothetical protein
MNASPGILLILLLIGWSTDTSVESPQQVESTGEDQSHNHTEWISMCAYVLTNTLSGIRQSLISFKTQVTMDVEVLFISGSIWISSVTNLYRLSISGEHI